MALDPQLLGEKLAQAATSTDPAQTKLLWINIAKEIIEHFTTFAVVQTTGSPSAQTGKIS